MTELMEKTIEAISLATIPFSNSNIQKVTQKGDCPANYVTNVDKEIERRLKKRLSKVVPEAGFIGEESDKNDYSLDYLWIVDPIDGTANFTRNIGMAFVSVALTWRGTPILGIIYNPITGDMWTGEKDQGAFLNGEPISVSTKMMRNSILNCHYDTYNKEQSYICFELARHVYPQIEDIRSWGSAAYSLASIATGQTEMMYCQNCYSWDIAAGLCILREAGGFYKILDNSDNDWRQSKATIIAANNQSSLLLLEELRKCVVHSD